MKFNKSLWLFLFIAYYRSRSATAGTCQYIEGAPYNDIHIQTCENAPQLRYSFTENYMVVSAEIASCATADAAGISTTSVYFNKPYYLREQYEHTLEYTFMATDVDANCVVNLVAGTPKNLTDQNCLSNDPLEDISQYAMNQWYTRTFKIYNIASTHGNRYVRVGLTCAARTPIATNTTTQTVLIRDIRLISTAQPGNVAHVYNHQLCAAGCKLTSVDGAICAPRTADGSAEWMYPTNLTDPVVKTAAPLIVLGHVKTKDLWIASSLTMTGCLTAMDPDGITVHLPASRNVTINYQLGCFLPRFKLAIDMNPQYSGAPMSSSYSNGCLHLSHPEKVITSIEINRISFYAGSDTVSEECNSSGWNEEPDYSDTVGVILVIVLSVVGAAGIFLAVFFGVRKCKRLQKMRSLTAVEVNME